MIKPAIKYIKPFISHVANIIFPPQCMICSAHVSENGSLCFSCWDKVKFIGNPQCKTCGHPFELDISSDFVCGQCVEEVPLYTKARAVFHYDENTSPLITSFKYGDRTHTAKYYANWMVRAGSTVIDECDIITSVPLHSLRLIKRKYNQSALLANIIGKISKKSANNNLIKRVKNTPPQASLTFNQRQENVRGAFSISKKNASLIKGKNILLIDDVMTTGSTIKACTKILLKAGANKVNVLTLARTVKE